MSYSLHHSTESNSLLYKVFENTGETVFKCYQCGKCSAGCPLSGDMDYPPSHVLRMIQLEIPELDSKVLSSYSIWLCLTCETCVTRCPQEVDLPKIIDYLRSESIEHNKVNPAAKDIIAFHKTFLDSIRTTGRLYEVGLIAGYKFRTFHLLQDVSVAPKMFLLGKLNPLPHIIKNRSAIEKIFRKSNRAHAGEEAKQ